MSKKVDTYLKDRINELLKRANLFEKRVLSDREKFLESQKIVQDFKRDNPSDPYDKVKDDLITMQESHYNSFLLEQNLQHTLNTIVELNTMASVLEIDLQLSEDYDKALKFISNSPNNLFTISDSDEVVLADNELRPVVEKALAERQKDPNNLRDMFSQIPPSK